MAVGAGHESCGRYPSRASNHHAFFPPVWKANSKALIIFPGGGYVGLAEHEGRGYAEYFASQGVHCFVVKYRLGGKDRGHHAPVQLNDAARSVRLVRSAAGELGIRPDCIGGAVDIYRLFRDLEKRVADPLDNGWVEGHVSLSDKAKFEQLEKEKKK